MGVTFVDILHGQDILDTVVDRMSMVCIAGLADLGMGNMRAVGT